MTKSHQRKNQERHYRFIRDTIGLESARESANASDTTGREGATESASTRENAKKNASLEVEATPRDREPHDHLCSGARASDHTLTPLLYFPAGDQTLTP